MRRSSRFHACKDEPPVKDDPEIKQEIDSGSDESKLKIEP